MVTKKTDASFIHPVIIILFVFVLLFIAAGTYLYMRRQRIEKTATTSIAPTAKPTPTPRAIPHGKIGFSVGGSTPNAPTFSRGYLDPYDPTKGTTQIISIDLTDKTGVLEVVGTVLTDHGQQPVTFSLAEGTAQKGRWEARWVINDTYLYTYNLKIVAKNAITKGTVEITLR
ncbi:MAG: hypothetical protein WAV51_00020 [Microgenomates group bacterium]